MARFFRIFRLVFIFLLILPSCESKEKKYQYLIGRDPSWYPLELGNNAIKLEGFTNALIHEIAAEAKVPLKITNVGWVNLFEYLQKGDYGGILSSLPKNQITTSQYEFSDPIIELGPVLIVPVDSKTTSLKGLNNLKDRIVGISQFSDAVLIVQKYPALQIELYENMPDALDDLVEQKVDAILLDAVEAQALIHSIYAGKLKIVSPPLSDKAIRVLTLANENETLIKTINEGLEKLKKSGRYQELRREFSLF